MAGPLLPPLITAPLITSHSSHHSSLHHFSHLTHHTTRVAGAVQRASSWRAAAFRVAGPFVWQAQYTELPGCLSCGRRNTQSFLEELRRMHPPGRAAARVAAAGLRLLFVWQVQYAEPPVEELRRAWPPLARGCLFVWQAQYTEPPATSLLEKLLHAWRSHTIFHPPSCHTPSFTTHLSHHFVRHHLSHTIFHTPLCQTPSFTHHLSHNFVTHHL